MGNSALHGLAGKAFGVRIPNPVKKRGGVVDKECGRRASSTLSGETKGTL